MADAEGETKVIAPDGLIVDGGEVSKKSPILPDTSWLVALLDEKDSHHTAAMSSLGALLPYKPSFRVPVLAAIETTSRLIRVNSLSVKEAKKKVIELVGHKLHATGANTTFRFREILKRYDAWSRRKVKTLTAVDFCIVTEGVSLGARILTTDLKMYRAVKKYYEKIYFMSDNVTGQESDLARLIADIQKEK